MNKIVLISLIVVAIVFMIISGDTNAAMDTCQETQSYETCRNTLLR